MTVTRRSVVLSAAAAGAAFGISGSLEILPSALAQGAPSPMNPKGIRFHKFKVGDIDVTTVFDGEISRDHNPGFIKNASVDDLKEALKKGGLPDDKTPNSYTVTFVRLGGKTVMFDAGNGQGNTPGAGLVAENAKAAGIEKVDAIVVTHFHPDHIFGLLTKDNGQVFADTEILVPEPEYKFWTDPGTISALPEARRGLAVRIQATLPEWKNLKRTAAESEVMPGIRAVSSYGHTPGHTSYLVGAGSGQLLVLGDVTNIPPINLANPGWHIVFDQDTQMAEATRRRLLDRAVTDKIVCTGYHWGMPGAGTVQKDGNGYALVPVA